MTFRTLDSLDAAGKRVLVRADLNVPVRDGKITDLTRIERLSPTIRELSAEGAKVIVCSHFDRPKGKRVPEMSLRPMADALSRALGRPVAFADDCIGPVAAAAVARMINGDALGRPVAFADDCIGPVAAAAVARMINGDILVLENTRFHPGEETNDAGFSIALASLADVFVNDAFSAAHRAHASTEGVAHLLSAYAGRLMQAELEALDAALGNPERPVAAIVGGAKVSTKLELLGNLVTKVNVLIIGGAMANTFLAAQGKAVGKSLQEAEMHETARSILTRAAVAKCEVVLPVDALVATEFRANPPTQTVSVDAVPADSMILDIGPASVAGLIARLPSLKTLVWNGPVGAFETPPFDTATMALAKAVADATGRGALRSVAGGGDTISALRQAGVVGQLSYVSSAGGAFLEWLEGKTLPGVAALG